MRKNQRIPCLVLLGVLLASIGPLWAQAEPTCSDPKEREFDFWIGEWKVYEGESTNREGRQVLNRITWHDNPDGTVRQHWETSADGGKTWETAFDGLCRKH